MAKKIEKFIYNLVQDRGKIFVSLNLPDVGSNRILDNLWEFFLKLDIFTNTES